MAELPKRKHNRLRGYDYSKNGAYFITVCVKDRHELLGTIVVAQPSATVGAIINRPQKLRLSQYGDVVDEKINQIANHYPSVMVNKYVIMPNHVHMILFLDNGLDDGRFIIAPTISTVI